MSTEVLAAPKFSYKELIINTVQFINTMFLQDGGSISVHQLHQALLSRQERRIAEQYLLSIRISRHTGTLYSFATINEIVRIQAELSKLSTLNKLDKQDDLKGSRGGQVKLLQRKLGHLMERGRKITCLPLAKTH